VEEVEMVDEVTNVIFEVTWIVVGSVIRTGVVRLLLRELLDVISSLAGDHFKGGVVVTITLSGMSDVEFLPS
jgi:hypothetical protein